MLWFGNQELCGHDSAILRLLWLVSFQNKTGHGSLVPSNQLCQVTKDYEKYDGRFLFFLFLFLFLEHNTWRRA